HCTRAVRYVCCYCFLCMLRLRRCSSVRTRSLDARLLRRIEEMKPIAQAVCPQRWTCELLTLNPELCGDATALTINAWFLREHSCIKLLRLPQLLNSGAASSSPAADGRPAADVVGESASNVLCPFFLGAFDFCEAIV